MFSSCGVISVFVSILSNVDLHAFFFFFRFPLFPFSCSLSWWMFDVGLEVSMWISIILCHFLLWCLCVLQEPVPVLLQKSTSQLKLQRERVMNVIFFALLLSRCVFACAEFRRHNHSHELANSSSSCFLEPKMAESYRQTAEMPWKEPSLEPHIAQRKEITSLQISTA